MPDKEMDKIEFDNLVIRIENLMMDLDTAQTRYVGQTGRQYVPPLRLAPRKRKESFEDSILREEARAMPYAQNCEDELMARLIPEPSKCECTPCLECGGHGTVRYSFSEEYSGDSRLVYMNEPEFCATCGGRGVMDKCDCPFPCAHKNQRYYSGMICHDCGKPQY